MLAQTILQVLEVRGIKPEALQIARVLTESDEATLGAWSQRVFSVARIEALFDPADG